MRLILFLFLVIKTNVYANSEDPTPTHKIGAKVFSERCVLCHGSQAMGDGVLPLKITGYPDTNLRTGKKANNLKSIHEAIVFGGTQKGFSQYMPPFGNELSWTELESVSKFVDLIRNSPNEAIALIETTMADSGQSAFAGQQIYSTRCVLCHGKYGEGDGRMKKLLKDPPPADLTASRVPDDYLIKIISLGGEAMGRSKHMPPWKDQINKKELLDLIEYLKSIRD